MSYRLAVALAAMLVASNSFGAAGIVSVLDDVPHCPDAAYIGASDPVTNIDLATSPFGPTPAGEVGVGKCGITEMVPSMPGSCPTEGVNYAFDVIDFWNAPNAPMSRIFRQELQINSFNGIAVGERVKITELQFGSGETVAFYLDRGYWWYNDLTVGYTACEVGCPEQEISRFNLPVGLPEDQAVPLGIYWTTGRQFVTRNEVSWWVSNSPPYGSSNSGWVELVPGARESLLSNGVVQSSCDNTSQTQVRFIEPRFD